jgi:hypothetical protein
MMNDEGGEKERMQRFPCMPSTNFASLACINIPLLHKNSAYLASSYGAQLPPYIYNSVPAIRYRRQPLKPHSSVTPILRTSPYLSPDITVYSLRLTQDVKRNNNVYPYVAENPTCRNDFMV